MPRNREVQYARQHLHRQANKDRLWKLLCSSSCVDCKTTDPRVLEFDHLSDFEKKFDVSRADAGSTRSWATILLEIAKCDIVCANCHRIRTSERGNFNRFQMFALMSE